MKAKQIIGIINGLVIFLIVFSIILTPILVLGDPLGLDTNGQNADEDRVKIGTPSKDLEMVFDTDPTITDTDNWSGEDRNVDFGANPTNSDSDNDMQLNMNIQPVRPRPTSIAEEATAEIWTDKDDYSPGEIVTVFGSGFNPDSSIEVNVTRPNDDVDTGSTVSNSTGHFVYYYDLNGILGLYNVTATDGVNSASTTFTDAAVQVDWIQGHNDKDNDDVVDYPNITWANGDINAQNSIVTEGNILPPYPPSIPGHVNYRAIISGLSAGTYNLSIQYKFSKGGKIAFDFLTTNYGITPENLQSQLPNFDKNFQAIIYNLVNPTNLSTMTFPLDNYTLDGSLGGGNVSDRQLEHDLTFSGLDPRVMKLYGATINSITQGAHSDGDVSVEIYFTKTSGDDQPILATWGGHLGIGETFPVGYGTGKGAASISGAPYHMQLNYLKDSTGTNILSGTMARSVQPSAIFLPANISGYKFHDLNGNGIKDDGESGLPDWTIVLNKTDGGFNGSTTTNELGYYEFIGLPAGTYNLTEILQPGWTNTTSPLTVIVNEGDHSINNNFGNFHKSIVIVEKYEDEDGDITTTDDWTLIEWGITLTNDTGTFTVPFEEGVGYTFPGQESETVTITEADDPAWIHLNSSTTYILDIESGQTSTVKFINFKKATIIVEKYEDTDGDITTQDWTLVDWNIILTNGTYPSGQTFALGTDGFEVFAGQENDTVTISEVY
ncbi:MAG: SdrD B-like domain-containing protein, partial [Candidatus Hodarchaeales archaeon]